MFIILYQDSLGEVFSAYTEDNLTQEKIAVLLNSIISKGNRFLAFCTSLKELEETLEIAGLKSVAKTKYTEDDEKVWKDFSSKVLEHYK